MKIEKNARIREKFFSTLIDLMIPEHKNKFLPKASKVININILIKSIFRNKELKKKLNKFFANESKNRSFNYQKLANKAFNDKIIEDYIAKNLLELYFSSKIVQKSLNMKINPNNHKKKDNRLLQKLLRDSNLRHKLG